MSITSPDDRISTYNPVVATTEFAAGFPIYDNDDIAVYHNGVERSDFTISATYIAGVSVDARAVFSVGITGKVEVVGARSPRRSSEFNAGAPLPTRDQNLALNTIVAESQEARRDILRSFKAPYGTVPPDPPLPAAERVIGWDEAGNLVNIDPATFIDEAGLATAAQGEKADSALQPPDIGDTVAAQDDRRIIQVMVADESGLYPGDGLAQRRLIITSDALDAIAHGIIARGYRLAHTFGGASMTGARIAAEFSAIHEAADDPDNPHPEGVVLTASFYGTSASGWGGTVINPRGSSYAFNAIATAFDGYDNIDNFTSAEFNTQMQTGSSARYKSIVQIVSRDQIHATVDVGLALSSITGAVGSKVGISFGDMNGDPPVPATGTLIGSYTLDGISLHPAAVGIDLTAWAFSDSLLKSGGYVIKAGGSVVAGATTAAQVQYDFKSSGAGSAYDARIAVAGGSATNGLGTMTVVAALTKFLTAIEFANVPGAPTTMDTFTITADSSAVYIRVKLSGGIYRATIPVTLEP